MFLGYCMLFILIITVCLRRSYFYYIYGP